MNKVKKLTLAAILIAVGVVCSFFYIPVGIAKCFPIQHLINILAGIFLGPIYSVTMAFLTSLIRVMTGTGSLLAFPGSMCGALLCGLLYKYTKNNILAVLGELVGTGIIGALIAYPMATLVMNKSAALFGFVIPFSLSSFGGVIIATIILFILKKTGGLNIENKNN